MRASHYFFPTLKEIPSDAELISHQYMLRAGMIRKIASGIVTWLPLGLRVLRKVEKIVREEMNRSGALEVLMPNIQPSELWEETGRWQKYGSELLRLQDRHQRNFCFGPTHEEVITHLVRNEIRSYKQLPINFYQIQTKFRDEIRPRFGVMRGREFIMKDAYSFSTTVEDLQRIYESMYQTYTRIFERLGLKFRAVDADTGAIGGENSHEFQVLADVGEDTIVFSDQSNYAANLEKAHCLPIVEKRPAAKHPMELVDTPNQRTISEVCELLKLPVENTVKLLMVKGSSNPCVALILRGDHELNLIKAEKHSLIAKPLTWVEPQVIEKTLGCEIGFLGPVGLKRLNIPVIADRDAAYLADFCCGANQKGKHLLNVNWGRDCEEPEIADLRNVVEGDKSPDGKGTLQLRRGIEVGHIFQLRDQYSKPMQAKVLDDAGKAVTLQMGCYGIGITRVVAAAIEQNHDDRGIIWPAPIAPFQIVLIPLNYHRSHRVREVAEHWYTTLQQMNYEVLFDDRNERPGVLFATADLIGIPHRLVLTEQGIDNHLIEYKARFENDKQDILLDQLPEFLKNIRLE